MMSWCMASWADSPLNSTDFWEAYSDHPMVVMAGEHGLGDVIVRLAVVKRLTWFSETNDFRQFENYLIKRYKAKDRWKLQKKLDASTLAVYAYAMAVSNRSDLGEASDLNKYATVRVDIHLEGSLSHKLSIIECDDSINSFAIQLVKNVFPVPAGP